MALVEVDLFGRFAVRRDGHEIATAQFGGRLTRRLVRILAARRGQVVSRDALIDMLWETTPPRDAAANLNVLVNRARRALGEPQLIETVPDGYVLAGGPDVIVDIELFEASALRSRQAWAAGASEEALSAVEEALALWAGEPLEEEYLDWARPLRDRLHRKRQEILECGAAAALVASATPRAVELATEAVDREPLREVAHLVLIRALAEAGDQAAALQAFERLRSTLTEELGIEPSGDAAELRQLLLHGDLSAASEPPRAAVPAGFLGRRAELEYLTGLRSDRRVAVLAGRSGSGKSRLLAEMRARSTDVTLSARAVLPERETPWSLARVLLTEVLGLGIDPRSVLPPRSAEVVIDLLHGSSGGDSVSVNAQSWRALLLQGLTRLLEQPASMALLVDDVQWADSSSLDLLQLLAQRAGDLVLVLAYRPEEVSDDSPVAGFLAQVRATARPREISLGPLPAEAICALVGPPDLAELLAQQTDGTPFAVLEVLRELGQAGTLRRDHAGLWQPAVADALVRAGDAARAGKQRAIWVRAEQEPRTRREVLWLLSLMGRPAPASFLALATGREATGVLGDLRALSVAELVRHGALGFSTFHDLIAETMRDRLDPVERARVHGMLADALAADRAPAAEIARHLAGTGDVPAAVRAYSDAAQDRLHHHADREAEQLADEGLSLDPSPGPRAALLEVRAETCARRGDLLRAAQDLRSALALADDHRVRSRLFARMAGLQAGSEDLLRATDLADLAIAEAGDDPAARARALYVAALIDMNLERPLRAEERFAAALALFTEAGDPGGIADILDARAMAQFLDGDIERGAQAFGRVYRLFVDAGDLLRVVVPQSTRGHGLVFAGKPEEARAETAAAVELARSLGYADGEAMALWHHSEALVACGSPSEGLDYADAALATARRVGHRGWTATGLRARGIALEELGDVRGAEAAFRGSLEISEHLSLFKCWGHARLASLLVRRARPDEAAHHVSRALSSGPPLSQYEARLAQCELAVARAEPGADRLIAEALSRAADGGHRVSQTVLAQLSVPSTQATEPSISRGSELPGPAEPDSV